MFRAVHCVYGPFTLAVSRTQVQLHAGLRHCGHRCKVAKPDVYKSGGNRLKAIRNLWECGLNIDRALRDRETHGDTSVESCYSHVLRGFAWP